MTKKELEAVKDKVWNIPKMDGNELSPAIAERLAYVRDAAMNLPEAARRVLVGTLSVSLRKNPGRNGGRKPGPFCPCGAMTEYRAKQNNHVCKRKR